jgi:hypothetical protein
MIDFELLFATEGQLITERGDPPEDCEEESEHIFTCKHGDDLETCILCRDEDESL